MRLITFLGNGRYQETKYTHPNGNFVKTAYVAHAIAQLWQADEVVALCTEEAERAHGKGLVEALCDGPMPVLRRIPLGRAEGELWTQFEVMREIMVGVDELLVDITHGFRSQPFFAAGALTYLKMLGALDDQRVEVLYGRFLPDEPEESPIWDLTPFLDLLDWAQGAALLVETGQADHLIDIATRMDQDQRRQIAASGRQDFPPTRKLVKALSDFADDLAAVRIASLTTGYAQDEKAKSRVTGTAARLIAMLEETREPLTKAMPALGPILDRVRKVAEGLPTSTLAGEAGQAALAALAHRYLDYRRYPEAGIVLREALVSRHAARSQVTDINASDFDEEERRNLDRAWGLENPVARTIADVRNDVEHGGFRRQPIPGAKLKEQLQRLVRQQLPEPEQPVAGADVAQAPMTYFVSRHPGALDWAAEEGVVVDQVVEHLDIETVAPGDTVIGSLPVNLAAEVCARGAAYLHLSLELPAELRGKELTAAEMRSLGAELRPFHVSC
jgi:CRISPR-associated protein Csx16